MATSTVEQTPAWQDIARKVQTHRDNTIASLGPDLPIVPDHLTSNVTVVPRRVLSSGDVMITETPAEELVASLAAGTVSATAVTKAFLRRAAIAQKLVRFILVSASLSSRRSLMKIYTAVLVDAFGEIG